MPKAASKPKTKLKPQKPAELLPVLMKAVATHGWQNAALEATARQLAVPMQLLFADGVKSAVLIFHNWADAQMLAAIKAEKNFERLKVRHKIAMAVEARLGAMAGYERQISALLGWSALPHNAPFAAKLGWQTMDVIWRQAGDVATDFNHYSKRGLLAAVWGTTLLFWLKDSSHNKAATWAFLEQRIDNVLKMGAQLNKVKEVPALLEKAFKAWQAMRPQT